MCEATAYLMSSGKEKEIMRDVALVEVHGKHLTFRDILGNEKKLQARIKKSTSYSIRLLSRSFRQHSVEKGIEHEEGRSNS